MPAKYHFVAPGIWNRTFRGCSVEAKVVAFNVWTNRARTSEGLYELSVGHIAEDTALTRDQVSEALRELHDAGVVLHDPVAEVVLDTWALKTSPHRNGRNKETGEVKPDRRTAPFVELFVRLPQTPLKQAFLDLADDYSPDLAAALRERVPIDPPEDPKGAHGPTASEDPSSTATSSAGLSRTDLSDGLVRCTACKSSFSKPNDDGNCSWCGATWPVAA